MLWLEYWQHQEQRLREQTLVAQIELEGLPQTAVLFQQLERRAKDVLRSYLRQCARRATGRILQQHPEGFFRSLYIARKLRRFVLDQCKVRIQIWIGPSGDVEYPEQLHTLPATIANHYKIHVRHLDKMRTKNFASFLAIDYASVLGAIWVYPEQGILSASTHVICPLPSPRKDRKTCKAEYIYSAAFAERSSVLKPMLEEFRCLVEIEERWKFLESKLQELRGRQQQSSAAQAAWNKIALPETQKLELMKQADLFLDGKLTCPQAVLLKGVPGTGKTLLASTLAEVLGNRQFFRPTIAELKHP